MVILGGIPPGTSTDHDPMPVFRLIAAPIFPPPEQAEPDGLLAVGGDLSAGRLLQAYRCGIFPWFEPGEEILWWSPDPRLVLDTDALHVSRSLQKTLRRGTFTVRFDTAFAQVIHACAATKRRHEDGTWISPEMEAAYTHLHELGYAHSAETWAGDELVGGVYGIHLGGCFFGESMFSTRTDASKVALVGLVGRLKDRGVRMLDCQVTSPHMLSLGAREIPRVEFLQRLHAGLLRPDQPERWS